MKNSVEVARVLLEIQAVKLEPNQPFTWASGIQSPIYCDNRVSLSHPAARNLIKKSLADAASDFGKIDCIAGVATAGIPHGALLADVLELPFCYVRSSAKDHGRKNLIEGEVQNGWRVLVIEDLISTGGSCLKVVETLREAGCEVAGVLAIFQYGFQKAVDAFQSIGVDFQTLTDYETLVKVAAESGYVGQTDLETLKNWRQNPEGWGALYA